MSPRRDVFKGVIVFCSVSDGVSVFLFCSKRNPVRIPEASDRKRKAAHRCKREQAPHQQTPGANPAENDSGHAPTSYDEGSERYFFVDLKV